MVVSPLTMNETRNTCLRICCLYSSKPEICLTQVFLDKLMEKGQAGDWTWSLRMKCIQQTPEEMV